MHIPSAFREDDPDTLCAIIRSARLAQFVTATATGADRNTAADVS